MPPPTKPPQPNETNKSLTDAQKLEIRNYLREQAEFWAKLLGIASAASVLSALIAFIFWLPRSAAVHAKELLVAEIASEREAVRKEAASSHAKLEKLAEEITEANKSKDELSAQVATLKNDVKQSATFLGQLLAYKSEQRTAALEFLQRYTKDGDFAALAKQLAPHLEAIIDAQIDAADEDKAREDRIALLKKEIAVYKKTREKASPAKKKTLDAKLKVRNEELTKLESEANEQ